jgi:hypothetical protein
LVIGERQYAIDMDVTIPQTYLYELNTDFNVIRKIKYNPTYCKLHGANPIELINCNDGSLAFVGNVDFYPETPNQRVWFVKTDTNYCDGHGVCDTVMNIFFYSADTVSKTDTLDFKFKITSNIDIPYEVWLGFYHKDYSYCCDGEVVHNVNINTINSIKINYEKLVEENISSSVSIEDTIYIRATIWSSSCTDRAEYCHDKLFMLVFTDGVWVKPVETPESKIKIYPNPATNSLTLSKEEGINKNTSVFIYDIYGREIKQLKIKNNKQKIDISNLEKGVYFVKIGSAVGRFVKE